MSNTMWWYVMRAAGLTSWLFLTLTVIWGTVASGRLLPSAPLRRWVVDLHPFLGSIGLGALVLHIVAALADTWVGLSWSDVLVPFTAEWHPSGIAAGVVALWMLAIVEVTSLMRRRLGKATWHRIHLVSYAMAWITGLHAVMNGSDLGNPVVAWTALALMATASGLALWRMERPNRPSVVVAPSARIPAPAPAPFASMPAVPPPSPPELVSPGPPRQDGWS